MTDSRRAASLDSASVFYEGIPNPSLASPHASYSFAAAQPQSCAVLAGLAKSCPEYVADQVDLAGRLASAWDLTGPVRRRWERIIDASGIDRRHAVRPVESILDLPTSHRMAIYGDAAPVLAESAARAALKDAAVGADSITDLVVVTCTGFAAPGVDVALVDRLGLSPDVRRTIIGFMGCYGGIVGLRQAMQASRATPGATVLVVCVELCSLHVRRSHDPENLVASALFADGAAAAVIQSPAEDGQHRPPTPLVDDSRAPRLELTGARSRLLPEGRSWMTWRITETGFAMTLARRVPDALRRHLSDLFPVEAMTSPGAAARPGLLIGVHPGGPGILTAAQQAIPSMDTRGVAASSSVLRDYGNMSSATILFVLNELLDPADSRPRHLAAFGPGLTVETLTLQPQF